jgi:hypothetical protein
LRTGDNVFEVRSDTEHHMLEVLWPGPALIVRQHDASAKAQEQQRAQTGQ